MLEIKDVSSTLMIRTVMFNRPLLKSEQRKSSRRRFTDANGLQAFNHAGIHDSIDSGMAKGPLLEFKDVSSTLMVSTVMFDRPLLKSKSRKSSRLTIYNY